MASPQLGTEYQREGGVVGTMLPPGDIAVPVKVVTTGRRSIAETAAWQSGDKVGVEK